MGVDTAYKVVSAGWDEQVKILEAGGYARHDFSTATTLLNIIADMKEGYGSLEDLREQSPDTKDLERKLQYFKGIGSVTA